MIHWISWILNGQTLATGFMTGLVWFVQISHYPLFQKIPEDSFKDYEREHVRRTGWIVAPTMLLELICCIALVYLIQSSGAHGFKAFWLNYANPALVGLNWFSTFFVQIPIHNRLQSGKDYSAIRKLTLSNWPRTILWTVAFIGLVFVR